MAVTLADIKKLRDITGAGMMDVKKALEEANGDFEVAKDLLRKRGQAIAAKRSEREASEGCVLAKAENGFGAIVAVKCETDFVAKNEDYVKMVKAILEVAMTEKPADLEALKACKLGDFTVQDAVTERSGVTGEKMELSDYAFLVAPKVDAYNHLGNKLSALVAADAEDANAEVLHGISMQVASMSPIALDADHVAQEVKDRELSVAIEKTKQDEINKAVEQTSFVSHFVSTFKRFCNKEYGENIWQRGFYDHVIRGRKDYEEIAKYIYENPVRWYYDELYAEE